MTAADLVTFTTAVNYQLYRVISIQLNRLHSRAHKDGSLIQMRFSRS